MKAAIQALKNISYTGWRYIASFVSGTLAIGTLNEGSVFGCIFFLITLFLCLPVTSPGITKFINQRWNFNLSRNLKIAIVIVAFILGMSTLDTTKTAGSYEQRTPQPSSSTTEQPQPSTAPAEVLETIDQKIEPSVTPTPTTTPAPIDKVSKTTATPKPTVKPTAKPVVTSVPATPPPVVTSGGSSNTSGTGGSYTGGDKDCSDFSSHAEAQAFFIAQGGPASDPHRLDRDKDGLACENN